MRRRSGMRSGKWWRPVAALHLATAMSGMACSAGGDRTGESSGRAAAPPVVQPAAPASAFLPGLEVGPSSALPLDGARAASAPHVDSLVAHPDPAPRGLLMADVPGAGDAFGYTISVDGDTAVVGERLDDSFGADAGLAHVFVRSDAGWVRQARLVADDIQAGDYFGWSVAISGDTAIVGAYGDDDGGSAAGSAYVFARSAAGWSQQAKLTADEGDAAAGDALGWSVAISGDTALVGARLDDHAGLTNAGSAYVFVRSAGAWSPPVKLVADVPGTDQSFGYAVAISGDAALVGAPNDDDAGTDAGAAYLFVRSGDMWRQATKLLVAGSAAGDRAGTSVAVDGSIGLVGAPFSDVGGTDAGSVYVVSPDGDVWTERARLLAGSAAAGDRFGWSVAVSSGVALLGAPNRDSSATDAGAAYVFRRDSGGSWSEQMLLLAPGAAAGDNFGAALALSGNHAIVGAPNNDAGGSNAGAADAFWLERELGDPCGLAAQCGSGFCVDGVCCDRACDGGACDACSVAAGASSDGVCANLDGTSCDDGDACTASDVCTAGVCAGESSVTCAPLDACHDAGVCDPATGLCSNPPGPDGSPCDDGDACTASDICVAGACAGESPVSCAPLDACHDAGVCDPATGLCSNPLRPDGAACPGGFCLDGRCTNIGPPCDGPADCALGFCVDGVCCDSPCDAPCMACAAALKSGGSDGVCGPARAGGDPHDDCAPQTPLLCGATGACDGEGACAQRPLGTPCGAASCSGPDLVPAPACDGRGACVSVVPMACGAYRCTGGACPSLCGFDGECVATAYCAAGACRSKKPLAADCALPKECLSGACLAGTCALDADNDAVADSVDRCPLDPDTTNLDEDGDGDGDACDSDDDNDGRDDVHDNCPMFANPEQADIDGDDEGDACDCGDALTQNGIDCDDGNRCTQVDRCQAGVCVGESPFPCPQPSPVACRVATCQPATGACVQSNAIDGTPCPGGQCVAGGCLVQGSVSSTTAGSGGAGEGGGAGAGTDAMSSSSAATGGDTGGAPPTASLDESAPLVLGGSGCTLATRSAPAHADDGALSALVAGLVIAAGCRRPRARSVRGRNTL
ncbi:FG-GAP repeat protein [Sorangium sp. So ce1182]|uniref:FG-GAP repeat protein n=1 Tax=Sorangium sp. So ce1182 TaxID=3133334 RepID=UPI003F63C630